jgi:hypothetical protein
MSWVFPGRHSNFETVAGPFCDVCCQIKARGRHAGIYSKVRRRGAGKYNGEANMRRRTEVGGTVGKLLDKLQTWLSPFRYFAGYNEGCSIKCVGQETVYYTDIKKNGRCFDV